MNRRAVITAMRYGIAIVFIGAGGAKLLSVPPMVAEFRAIPVGPWFRYAVGLYEIASAILLAMPDAAWLGTRALILLMIGGAVTEVVALHRFPVASGAMLAVCATLLSLQRRPH